MERALLNRLAPPIALGVLTAKAPPLIEGGAGVRGGLTWGRACPPNASANLRPDRGWASMSRFDGPPATAHPSGEGLPRNYERPYTGRPEHGKSRLLGRLALGGVRSGSRVGDALRLPGLEDDHLAAAVDGRCLGDVRNPDEPDCCAGETNDEHQERKGGDGSARRLLMNSRECGLADNRKVGLEDDFGSDDVVRPVVGRMSARGHEKYVGRIDVRVVPCSSDAGSRPTCLVALSAMCAEDAVAV